MSPRRVFWCFVWDDILRILAQEITTWESDVTADMGFLCVFLVMVFFGWRSGVLGQVLRVVAALAVIFGTAPVSLFIRHVLFQEDSPASPGLEIGSMVLAAVCIYIVVSVVGWLIIKALHTISDSLSMTDKLGGAGIGGVKALLIIYVLASLLLMVFGALEASDPKDGLHLRNGVVTDFVSRHNLIAPWRYPEIRQLHAAMRVSDHAKTSERGARAVREHKKASDFLRKDAFKALLKEDKLVQAAWHDQYALSLFHPKVRETLKDQEFAGALKKIDWSALEKSLGIGPKLGNMPVKKDEKATKKKAS